MNVEPQDSVLPLARQRARAMLAGPKRGKIINIASMLSFQGGDSRRVLYGEARAGIAGLTQPARQRMGGAGHQRQCDRTRLLRDQQHDGVARRCDSAMRIFSSAFPRDVGASPANLAGAAVFLASAASDYVHGAIIPARRRLARAPARSGQLVRGMRDRSNRDTRDRESAR